MNNQLYNMKKLNTYVPNNLVVYLKEGSEGKKRGDTFTAEQEILTCIIFDYVFNQGKEFNPDTLLEDCKSTIDAITQIRTGKPFVEICTNFLTDKEWKKSFSYQVDTFSNFLKANPQFDGPLHFIHHDTSIDVFNGQAKVTAESKITERVENMYKVYGHRTKDDYQKADIYAVKKAIDNVKGLPTIEEEIAWWSQMFTDGEVLGISLKKLGSAVSKPKVYNLKDISENATVTSVKLEFNPFKGMTFENEKKFKKGIVSAKFDFNVDWDEEKESFSINIRSTGKAVTVGATKKGAKAQQGNCTNFLKRTTEGLITYHENTRISADEIEKALNDLRNKFVPLGLKENMVPTMTDDARRCIDWLYNDAENIDANYKGNKDIEDLIWWRDVIVKQIDYLNAIFELTLKEKELAIKRGIEVEGPESLLFCMWTLLKGCKGINQDNDNTHLPYLMIG